MTNSEKDLLLSILAMDAYNQGYGKGLNHGETQIGAANFDDDKGDAEAQDAGFYAVSYTIGSGVVELNAGTIVISYRGTNEDSTQSSEFFLNILKDVWNGCTIGAGDWKTDQNRIAKQFFSKY